LKFFWTLRRAKVFFFLLRSLTLETDRLKRLEDDLRKREVTVSNTELHVDQQVQMKLNKYNI